MKLAHQRHVVGQMQNCNVKIDRDVNGARGIFLRALLDGAIIMQEILNSNFYFIQKLNVCLMQQPSEDGMVTEGSRILPSLVERDSDRYPIWDTHTREVVLTIL
ncbi:9401_t:CDS:2 [Diversispora eburnea]|uniref:9401_t:CDS:1 n=1 Tax=Diversispora eburnea TaxID=1213867 RepID=A0A9N9F5U6_9GLOM|nr:9401_t:CDS:2 [Diversispora eburnea]